MKYILVLLLLANAFTWYVSPVQADEIRYVEVVKIVPSCKVVEKTVPLQLKYFESEQELLDYLNATPRILPSYERFDCEDYASGFQQMAIERGYYMSTEVEIVNGENHLMNSTFIWKENKLVIIEPQKYEIVNYYNLD